MHNGNGSIHAAVAAVEGHLSRLPAGEASEDERATIAALVASWRHLVKILALGPAPETRECPACGQVGMRAATLCGYCWTRLEPL